MNTDTYMARRLGPQVAVRTTALMALLALAPVAAIAQSPAAAGDETRTANLSLADLDLSTPAGVDAARDHRSAALRSPPSISRARRWVLRLSSPAPAGIRLSGVPAGWHQ
jgi:hypothetical protein